MTGVFCCLSRPSAARWRGPRGPLPPFSPCGPGDLITPTPRPRTEQTTTAHAEQVLTHGLRAIRLHELSILAVHYYDAFVTDLHVVLSSCGQHVRSVAVTVNGVPAQLPLAELKNADHNKYLRPALKTQSVSMTRAGMASINDLPADQQTRLAHVISAALFQADPGHPLLTHLNAWVRTEKVHTGDGRLDVTLPDRLPNLPLHLLTALADAWNLKSQETDLYRSLDRACSALVKSLATGKLHTASNTAAPGVNFTAMRDRAMKPTSTLLAALSSGHTTWSFELPATQAPALLEAFNEVTARHRSHTEETQEPLLHVC